MNKPPSKRKKTTSAVSNNSKTFPKSANDFLQDKQEVVTIDVAAVEVPELTEDEQRDRLHLERKVEKAFFEAGKALMELRDRRLYRSTHKTFEEYCKDRFGFERRHPYRLIEAAIVLDNLMQMCPIGTQIEADSNGDEQMCPNGTQIENDSSDEREQSGSQAETELSEKQMRPNGTQILPTSERQVRPLTKLEPQQQQKVWQMAVEEAGGKLPSGRIVKDVVQRIMERTKVPNTYCVGEVCQILSKDNPDLRGKGGSWCIVTHVGEFSCQVEVWDGEYTIRIDHLKPLNYSDAECQQMRLICDRIRRLRENENLEETGRAVLKHLGEVKRPYLTQFEEKLLGFIKQEYQVKD